MNSPRWPSGCVEDLQAFEAVCQDLLTLTRCEHLALSRGVYRPGDFPKQRKDLIPRMEAAFTKLRAWRQRRPRGRMAAADGADEVQALIQRIGGLCSCILALDRENQQALLRRSVGAAVPAPGPVAGPSGYVAGLYRRHAGR